MRWVAASQKINKYIYIYIYIYLCVCEGVFLQSLKLHRCKRMVENLKQNLCSVKEVCNLALSWRTGVRHPQHTQIYSNSFTITADNSTV
jgi:hypothetical protein